MTFEVALNPEMTFEVAFHPEMAFEVAFHPEMTFEGPDLDPVEFLAASRGLTDYSQVDMLGVRYKSVNLRKTDPSTSENDNFEKEPVLSKLVRLNRLVQR